jgi:hypothetical protein
MTTFLAVIEVALPIGDQIGRARSRGSMKRRS